MGIDKQYFKRLGVEQDHPTLGFWAITLEIGTDIDTTFELMELKPGMRIVDSYLDTETVAAGAGSLDVDLATDEGTPYEWHSAIDVEASALTRQAVGKGRIETGTNKLVLFADYTGAITTAGLLHVMVLLIRQEH